MPVLKDKIIEIGRLLWDKGLVTGFNGNISTRVDAETLLITATGTCLGYLKESDIVRTDLKGHVMGQGKASSETLMHTAIYSHFPETQAVVHTHTTYTNGFFLAHSSFVPQTFEAKFYLGQVRSIEQTTPSVTDVTPVVAALKTNSIVVLRRHGVVAVGPDLLRAFVLIQELEEQIKTDLVSVHYRKDYNATSQKVDVNLPSKDVIDQKILKKYALFSKEQIQAIVNLVNADTQMQELGKKTAMTMDLAVCLQETGEIYSFKFENGCIIQTAHDAGAEFVITASEGVWRSVFNREIDPFVATTQKKMHLRGDFARISKWYAPCSRIFQLWTQVPVE